MTTGIKPYRPSPSPFPPDSLESVVGQAGGRILLLRMLAPFGRAWPVVLITMGIAPLGFGVIPGSALAATINPWLARGGLGVIILLIVGGLQLAVRSLGGFADEIESLLSTRRHVRVLIDAVDSFYGTIASQLALSFGVAAFACAVLYKGLPNDLEAGVGDYLSLGWLTFVIANGLYWCWRFVDFAAHIARSDLQFGELDPRDEYALARLKAVLRGAIAVISVELMCTAVVAWFLQLPTTGGSIPWPIGILTLQMTGLAIMIALLTRFSWALVQLNRAIKREERARIGVYRRKRDAIKRPNASPEALARRLHYENELKRLRRSPFSSAFDLLIAVLGPLAPLVLAAIQVYLMLSALEP